MNIKTKIISFLISVVMITTLMPIGSLTIFASDESQGLLYELSEDGKYYTVSGIGTFSGTELNIPSTYNGLPVTKIDSWAFHYCDNITNINIPNSITTIGAGAFAGCTGLTNITLPQNITSIERYTFSDCSKLLQIIIPSGIIEIGKEAFENCSSLASINIPDSVESIGDRAFGGCDNLQSVHIDNLSSWCKITFESMSANPLYCAENLYLNNSLVTTLTIPSNISSIGNYAFYNCHNLKVLTISEGVTSIGIGSFAYSEDLETAILPDSVTSIENGAFTFCESLKSVDMPNTMTYLGTGVFHCCDSLSSIVLPEGITSIPANTFYGCWLTSINIPDTVTSIGDCAFYECRISNIEIPNGVKSIGNHAFWNGALKSISLPDSVETIGTTAFYKNNRMETIRLSRNLKAIGRDAFKYCTRLESAVYPGSEEQWNAINVLSGNNALTDVLSFLGTSSDDFYDENQNNNSSENEDDTNSDNGTTDEVPPTVENGFSVFSDISSLSVKKGGKITIGVSAYTNGKIVEDVSGITFSIDDSNIAKRSKVSSLNNQFSYVTLEGVDIGTTYITFSDSNTGYVARVPITVFQDHLHSYTLSAVPTQNIDKYESNFYNVNGLFVDNYTYAVQADGRANVSFDVYNTNYIYGMVEIYDSNGQLKDAVMIDKVKNNATSIKGAVWDNFWCLARDIVDGDLLTYRQESGFSKKTSISVTIPKDGYIKITNDPQTSWLVSLINGVDLTMQISSLNKKVSNYDPNDSGFVSELTKKIVNEKIKTEAISKSQDLAKELNKNIAKNMSKSSDALGNFINTFTKNLNALNFDEIVIETCSDMGIGMAENVFIYFAGPIGKVLESCFTGIEFGNMTLQYCHFMQYSNAGAIAIQNQGGGVRSAEQIKVESNIDFNDDVALDVYKVEPSLDFLKALKQNYPELYNEHRQGLTYTYNITLVKNGVETQPNGEVDVYIPIPQNLRNISYSGNVKVYRIEEDNTLTEMDAKVSGDCLLFKTTHFSLYTIVAEADVDEPICDVLDYSYMMLDDNYIAITKYNGTDEKISIPSVIDGYIVTQISSYCFANNNDIQYVELPSGMIALGDKAFSGCTNLKSIYIYNNIEGIGNSALEKCTSLVSIYYGGTEAEWSNIKVYPNNDCLSNVNIVYECDSSDYNDTNENPPVDNSDNSSTNTNTPNIEDSISNNDDSNNDGIIIAIVVGSVVLLAVVGLMVYLLIIKKKRH